LGSPTDPLTSLVFNDLVGVTGALSIGNSTTLATLGFPTLGYAFSLSLGSSGPLSALTSLDLSALQAAGAFTVTNCTVLTSLSLAALRQASTITISGCTLLTSISAPVFSHALGTVSISGSALLTISFPAATVWTFNITITGNSTLTSIVLGTPGTLLKALGSQIDLQANALTATAVNAILALLVSLDGSNGTTTWGSGKTLVLSGGTNAAPTGQGATDKATLQARGATVTTN